MALFSSMQINELALSVYLGWPTSERALTQTVFLDIRIDFHTEPTACLSDELKDTFCYAALIAELRAFVFQTRCRLIEQLTQKIFDWLKTQLPENTTLHISLTKHPSIKELGSVTFSLGDQT